MCIVSMVADDFIDRFPWGPYGPQREHIPPMQGDQDWTAIPRQVLSEITREEFEELKSQVEALTELLKAAKIYDEKTNQKDCEKPEKVAFIKELAKHLGVDLGDLFDEKA